MLSLDGMRLGTVANHGPTPNHPPNTPSTMPCTCLAAGQALSTIARGDRRGYAAAAQTLASAQAVASPVKLAVIAATATSLARLAARRTTRRVRAAAHPTPRPGGVASRSVSAVRVSSGRRALSRLAARSPDLPHIAVGRKGDVSFKSGAGAFVADRDLHRRCGQMGLCDSQYVKMGMADIRRAHKAGLVLIRAALTEAANGP